MPSGWEKAPEYGGGGGPFSWVASIALFALITFGIFACQRAAAPQSAEAQPAADTRTLISGIATISDGDTVRFNGMRVRIWGIDAPEDDQMCGDVNAGAQSLAAIDSIIPDGGRVECVMVNYDGRNNRPNAVCTTSEGVNIGARMVELGWAWDYREYSEGEYQAQQGHAEQARLGVHALTCELPWDLRVREREEARARRESAQ
mgnify:CR=1 FL=1